MNKFQKNLHYLTNVVILLFVYAVNFNIFNELLESQSLVFKQAM